MITVIQWSYDNSEDAMYGNGATNIDTGASEGKFEGMLTAAFERHYPFARVSVEANSRTFIDNDGEGDMEVEEANIRYIAETIWSGFEWIVTKK